MRKPSLSKGVLAAIDAEVIPLLETAIDGRIVGTVKKRLALSYLKQLVLWRIERDTKP